MTARLLLRARRFSFPGLKESRRAP